MVSYTVEKDFAGHRVYIYYYLTLPLQADRDEAYVIVDFVGYTPEEQEEETNPVQFGPFPTLVLPGAR